MYLGILSIILQSEAIEKLPDGQQTFAILADAFGIDVYQARLPTVSGVYCEKT